MLAEKTRAAAAWAEAFAADASEQARLRREARNAENVRWAEDYRHYRAIGWTKEEAEREIFGRSAKRRLAAQQEKNAAEAFFMGVAFEEGRGVHQSDEEAMRWYQLAADQGHAYAQCFLTSLRVSAEKETSLKK